MTKQHTITIEGLPEGWKAVAFRVPKRDELIFLEAHIQMCNWNVRTYDECVIVEKIQPRRIVLEETGEATSMDRQQILVDDEDNYLVIRGAKIWREVEEGE